MTKMARVVDNGNVFNTYVRFARRHGYPDAVKADRRDLEDGEIVTLLTSGPHEWPSYGTLWIVEAADGERYIIGEAGLEMLKAEEQAVDNVKVLADESIGGLLREFKRVERFAIVGERIEALKDCGEFYAAGDIGVVTALYHDGEVRANFSNRGKRRVYGGDNKYVGSDIGYVVLEPTDVVVIGGQRYQIAGPDVKAAVGDRVVIVAEGRESAGGFCYRKGDAGTVVGDGAIPGNTRVDFSEREQKWAVSPGDYRVITPVEHDVKSIAKPIPETSAEPVAEPTIDALIDRLAAAALKITELEREVLALKDELDALKAGEPGDPVGAEITTPVPTPQEQPPTRDEIVQRAKDDMATLEVTSISSIDGTWRGFWPHKGGITTYIPMHRVEYVIDAEKRTVVALVTYESRVCYRGIAKCAPGDVFNAHIGKAIALRRALKLPVPTEYTSAPQPVEPRVGNVVHFTGISGKLDNITTLKSRKFTKDAYSDGEFGRRAFIHSALGGWIADKQFRILDDTVSVPDADLDADGRIKPEEVSA